jgi:hypothetical protein
MPQPRPLRVAAEKALADLRYESTIDPSPMARRSEPKPKLPPASLTQLLARELELASGQAQEADEARDYVLRSWRDPEGGWAIPASSQRAIGTSAADGDDPLYSGGSHSVGVDLALRPPSTLLAAGAEYVDLPLGYDSAVSVGSEAAITWAQGGTVVGTSKMTFNRASFGEHDLEVMVRVSRRLALQNEHEPAILAQIRDSMVNAIEAAAFSGAGFSGVPQGLLGTSAITSGSISSTPTKAELVALCEPIIKVAPADAITIMLAADSFAELTGSSPVVTPVEGQTGAFHVNGIRAMFSAHVPAGSCIVADFSKYTVRFLGGAKVLVDPYTEAASGQVRIKVNQHLGFAARQLGSFRRGVAA